MLKKLANLIEVKSIVTLALTAGLMLLLFNSDDVSKEVLILFSNAYTAVMTYFFTRKNPEKANKE
ncbi:MAG: hypothetical protein RSA62_08080 [Oscillospiraceae bacterium]